MKDTTYKKIISIGIYSIYSDGIEMRNPDDEMAKDRRNGREVNSSLIEGNRPCA